MTKKYLTKEMILQVNDLPVMEFEVKELDAVLILKTLSAGQITSLQGVTQDNADEYFYKIIAMSLVDENGDRLITNNEAKKILGNWSMAVLTKIMEQIKKLNHLDETVESKAGELKDNPLENS